MSQVSFIKRDEYPTISLEQLEKLDNSSRLLPRLQAFQLRKSSDSTLISKDRNGKQASNNRYQSEANFRLPMIQSAVFSSQKYDTNSSQPISEKKQLRPTILTTAQTLQNKFIANKIDIDLGSLNDFLTDPVLSASFVEPQNNNKSLKFKRIHGKSDGHKDNQQKADNNKSEAAEDEKEHEIKKSKYSSPLEALKHEDDEKKRQFAAKQIISSLFRQNFGEDVDRFEEISAKEVYRLRNQDENLEPDHILAKFIKKNARKTLKEKLKSLQEALDDQTLVPQPSQAQVTASNLATVQSLHPQSHSSKQLNPKTHHNGPLGSIRKNLSNNRQIAGVSEEERSHVQQTDLDSGGSHPRQSQEYSNIPPPSYRSSNIFKNIPAQENNSSLKSCFSMEKSELEKRQRFLGEIRYRTPELSDTWQKYESGQDQSEKLFREFVDNQIRFYQMYTKRVKNHEHWKERKKRIVFTDADFEDFSKEYHEVPRDEIFIFDHKQFLVWNSRVESPFALFVGFNYSPFSTLMRLELMNTKMEESGLLIILETVLNESFHLQMINLGGNQIGQRVGQTLDKIISSRMISVLGLRNVGMSTKTFCGLCISIANNQSIKDLDVSENLLDDRSIETIKVVIRFIKDLQKLNISKNQISDIKIKDLKKLVADSQQKKEVVF